MGCFSFLCKESGKPANSTSFDGSPCRLFLLEDGKVIEEMHGNYDSYGRVFDENGESFKWNMKWSEVCNLMFSDDETYGIALVLDKYWTGNIPTTRSEDDPNQGWGDGGELMTDCSEGGFLKVENPYHKVYGKEENKVTATITADNIEQLQLLVEHMSNSGEQANCFVEENIKFEYDYETGDINITTYED